MQKTFLLGVLVMSLLSCQLVTEQSQETRTVGDKTRALFYQAWQTGDWDAFVAMIDKDDFTFQFPAGPFGGVFKGQEAIEKFHAFVAANIQGKNRVISYSIHFALADKDMYAFTDYFKGVFWGQELEGENGFFWKIKNGKIIEFREYMGFIPALNAPKPTN